MINERILDYGKQKELPQRTLDRWLDLAEDDQEALLRLAQGLNLGKNHLRDFLDWLEEISLRDGVTPSNILKREPFIRITSDPRLGRGDRLKRIKEEMRRIRFPRLSQLEDEIKKRIRGLKLLPQIQMTIPSGLESGALTVCIKASSYEELRKLVGEIGQALDREGMKEIFSLLRGESDGGI